MTPAEQENAIRAQCRRCTEEIKKGDEQKAEASMGCDGETHHQKTPPADCAAGRQPPGVRSKNWPA